MKAINNRDYSTLIAAATQKIPCDLTVKNVKLVNVLTGEIYPASVDVKDGVIVHVQPGEACDSQSKTTVDGQGKYLLPGFVEIHMHVESSMLTPERFGREAVLHGTTSAMTDPHEIGNVCGMEGILWMVEDAKRSPMRQFNLASSCIPADAEFETVPFPIRAPQMAQLLEAIHTSFDLSRCLEFTVEGGRPDTLDEEKLRVIKAGGATRISINPQTMSDKVLAAVGRRHTARQTIEAFYQAVRAGFDDINMDLIAGLPDDDEEGFADSIRQVLALGPSNITVHTLALKKGAALFSSRAPLPPQEAVAAMLAGAEDALRDNGYEPYYLYRQKYMSGSFENTGWCRPGYTGLYNIYMMEELHTILSLGGGGMNKINLPAEKLARYHNPKIPQDYISRIDTILQQKDEIFSLLRQIREQNPEGGLPWIHCFPMSISSR